MRQVFRTQEQGKRESASSLFWYVCNKLLVRGCVAKKANKQPKHCRCLWVVPHALQGAPYRCFPKIMPASPGDEAKAKSFSRGLCDQPGTVPTLVVIKNSTFDRLVLQFSPLRCPTRYSRYAALFLEGPRPWKSKSFVNADVSTAMFHGKNGQQRQLLRAPTPAPAPLLLWWCVQAARTDRAASDSTAADRYKLRFNSPAVPPPTSLAVPGRRMPCGKTHTTRGWHKRKRTSLLVKKKPNQNRACRQTTSQLST